MKKLSFTTYVLLGLSLGVFVGVFIGERARIFNPIGNGFIRLLQMAVLPYFIVALPLGFGRLTYEEAKLTGIRLALFSATLWLMAMLPVVLLPMTFPTLESASFFSVHIVEPTKDVDFVELYIPANPFSSLSGELKRNDGTIPLLYSHWIEGKTAEKAEPRWNVLTNVLGWQEY